MSLLLLFGAGPTELLLLPGTEVAITVLDSANRVICVVSGSSPLVAEDATFDTVGAPLRYSVTPREIVVLIQGGDAVAAQAVADAQLAFRRPQRVYISGLRLPVADGLKITRDHLVGVRLHRAGIDASYPIRRITHDFKTQTTTIEVGDYAISPRDTDGLFYQLAKAVSQLRKEAGI